MLRPLAAIACAIVLASAADPIAPTREQWEPVQAAIAAKEADAETRLAELLKRFSKWSDGHLAKARLAAERRDWAAVWSSAREALSNDKTSHAAGALGIQALGKLKRTTDALTTAKFFTDATDPQGWVAYQMAAVALQDQDSATGQTWLDIARKRLQGRPQPSEFLFLDGRLAVMARDYARGEASFARAAAADANSGDAWYELGRVRLVLGQQTLKKDERDAFLAGSEAAFAKLVALAPKDAEAHTYLGRARLAQAKAWLEQNDKDRGQSRCADAVQSLTVAKELAPESVPTRLALGEALLRLDNFKDALPNLQFAADHGVKDRELSYNLATALGRLGRAAEASALLAQVAPERGGELVTTGMSAHDVGNHALAAQFLAKAAVHPEVASDTKLAGACWRYAGHSYRRLAEAALSTDRAALLDQAAAAYRSGGDLADWPSRYWFVSTQTPRSPELAAAAGWQQLSWNSYISPGGWMLVLGNYGAVTTGGEDLAGMWRRSPVHLCLWILVILTPVVLFVWARLAPSSPGKDPGRARDATATAITRAPRGPDTKRPTTSKVPKAPTPPPTRSGTPRPPGTRPPTGTGNRKPTGTSTPFSSSGR
ncbi:hypothetical protein LBMAG53_10970 [Planctomycetota bacterium]|nr:hypothetical protein LBMAG53_10970 [Planctomycetota bacterium]